MSLRTCLSLALALLLVIGAVGAGGACSAEVPAAPLPPAPPPMPPVPPSPAVGPMPADFAVGLSDGGGVAGSYQIARMEAGGQLVAGVEGPGARTVQGPILDAMAREKLWSVVSAAHVETLGCVPGNMTSSVSVTANGKTANACSAFGANPAVDSLYGNVASFLAPAVKLFHDTPPPLPPPPEVLWLEVLRDKDKPLRLVHLAAGAALPPELKGAKPIDDVTFGPLWEKLVRGRVFADLSHEVRGGKPLNGAPYRCDAGETSLRVRMGTGEASLVQQGCVTAAEQERMAVIELLRALR